MKSYKVLLVYPNPSKESPAKPPPLAILYVGIALEAAGHDVVYFDERQDSGLEELIGSVDVVGVSSISGYQLSRAISILKLAKFGHGKITVLGGVHATLEPMQCIQEPYIDFVVVGEGERTMPALLEHLDAPSLVEGIWHKMDGPPRSTTPRKLMEPNEIPSPVSDLTIRFFKAANATKNLMFPASRGCPYSCGFCANVALSNCRWRAIPLDRWFLFLEELFSRGLDIAYLEIGDDWLGDEKRVRDIGKYLYSHGIKWHASLRINQVNYRFIREMAELGCTCISFGVESGSPRILAMINKKITTEGVKHAAGILRQFGSIKLLYFFIMGFPEETEEDLRQTMELMDFLHNQHGNNCQIALFCYTPFPGTPLYAKALEQNARIPRTLEDWSSFDRSNSYNKTHNNMYYIAGLTFHRGPGSKTAQNFPGIRRLLILPWEWLCVLRWKLKFFKAFDLERVAIRFTIKHFSKKLPQA